MGTEAVQDFDSQPDGSAAAATVVADGQRVVVCVRGEIDVATAGTLAAVLNAVASSPAGAVVVDLSETTFLDTNGLRALLTAEGRLAAGGRPMTIRNPRRSTLRLLTAAGAGHLLEAA